VSTFINTALSPLVGSIFSSLKLLLGCSSFHLHPYYIFITHYYLLQSYNYRSVTTGTPFKMRAPIVLLAALSAVTSAHSDPQGIYARLPKLVGGAKFMANLKARNLFSEPLPAVVQGRAPVEAESLLEARVTNTCGQGVGSCDPGYCCSAAG
jgi:hypothetical protein